MFNYLTFLCTPHRWCCIKKYLLSFKERKNWVTANAQIHTKDYFMYYNLKKTTTTLTLIPRMQDVI